MSREHFSRSVSNALRMAWKRSLSYCKRDWEFADYPVAERVQEDAPPSSRHWARILGWNLDGLGETRADALRTLEQTYMIQKARRQVVGKGMPRPGTAVPIEFASQELVNAQSELMEDFIHRVLELQWAFISDESSLWDFHGEDNNDTLLARIRDVYAVDVSDIDSGNIALILERIAQARVTGGK